MINVVGITKKTTHSLLIKKQFTIQELVMCPTNVQYFAIIVVILW